MRRCSNRTLSRAKRCGQTCAANVRCARESIVVGTTAARQPGTVKSRFGTISAGVNCAPRLDSASGIGCACGDSDSSDARSPISDSRRTDPAVDRASSDHRTPGIESAARFDFATHTGADGNVPVDTALLVRIHANSTHCGHTSSARCSCAVTRAGCCNASF